MRVTVSGIDEVSRRFTLRGRRLRTWRTFFLRVARDVAKAEIQWFASRGAGRWPPLSPEYASWKQKHYPGRPLLVREGDLKEAATDASALLSEVYAGKAATLSIKDPKARFHALGAGHLPRRDPSLPLTQTRRIIREALKDHTRSALGLRGHG